MSHRIYNKTKKYNGRNYPVLRNRIKSKKINSISQNTVKDNLNKFQLTSNTWEKEPWVLPPTNSNPLVMKYQLELLKHMKKFEHVKWYKYFLYSFAYRPNELSKKHALDWITQISQNTDLIKFSEKINLWLKNNKNKIQGSLNDSNKFLHLIIEIINIFLYNNNEMLITDKYIFSLFSMTI